jgi:hypothetical protein
VWSSIGTRNSSAWRPQASSHEHVLPGSIAAAIPYNPNQSRLRECPPRTRNEKSAGVNLESSVEVCHRFWAGQPFHNPVREGLPTTRPEFSESVPAAVSGPESYGPKPRASTDGYNVLKKATRSSLSCSERWRLNLAS